MTQLKESPKVLFAGLVMILVVAAIIIGFSATPMNALESSAPVEAPIATPAPALPSDSAIPEAGEATFSGSFDPDGPYRITGEAIVLERQDGTQTLRLSEEFNTPAGPLLVIYLRADNGDFVNLGTLQSLSGEQGFAIPEGIDISEFSEVQVWCEPFGINFGSAFASAA